MTLSANEEFSSGSASDPDFQETTIHVQSGSLVLRHVWDEGEEEVVLDVGANFRVPEGHAFVISAGAEGALLVLVGDIGGHLVDPTILRFDGNRFRVGSGEEGRANSAFISQECGNLVLTNDQVTFWVPGPNLSRVLSLLSNHFRLVCVRG